MTPNYRSVTTIEGIRAYIGNNRIAAFDFETAPDAPYRKEAKAALDPAKAHIVGCSFSTAIGTGIYPHALPPELPTFSPFQGATSTAKFPLILPQKSPSAHPFRGIASQPTFPLIFSRILSTISPSRGILWGDFGVKSWKYFRNSDNS